MTFIAQNAVHRAQSVLFRSTFKIGPKQPRALNDEEIALVHFCSLPSRGGTHILDEHSEDADELKAILPPALHGHYDKLRADPRFLRFALFSKGQGKDVVLDGMVVGFAKDEFYYIVAVWDINGHDIWEPNPGDERTPLVVWD